MGAVTLVLEDGAGRDRSWSLENVSTKATRTLMTELVTAHPERVAFGVFDSADFGSPQSRMRLIAGPPKLIRMLQGIPCARHVSIRDAFEKAGKELPRTGCLLQKPDSKPERRTHERGVGLKPRASPCVLGTFTGAVRPRSRASKPSTSPIALTYIPARNVVLNSLRFPLPHHANQQRIHVPLWCCLSIWCLPLLSRWLFAPYSSSLRRRGSA